MRELLLIYGMALLCSSCTNDFGAFSFGREDKSLPRETGVISVDSATDTTDADAGAQWNVRSSDAVMDSGDTAGDAAVTDATGA